MSNPEDYTVGWICAVSTEYVAAQAFLDEKHEGPEYVPTNDNNDYILGKVGKHNVVISVLPHGEYGISSATGVARDMLHSFPNVRIGLMVGIGGGAPGPKHDIRLGDIVVSATGVGKGAVLQYDFGKTIQDQEFQETGVLNQPPTVLRAAVNGLMAQYKLDGHRLEQNINGILEKKPRLRQDYKRPDPSTDRLYRTEVTHPPSGEASCSVVCGDNSSNLIPRRERTKDEDNPAIHYGLIASANQLMKDAVLRDKFAMEKDVLCFEMEAAGLMNQFPCLAIRGICDYSDTHKNKEWQGYAAMAAAAYAKDLLCRIPPKNVVAQKRISEQLGDFQDIVSRTEVNVETMRSRSDKEEDAKILSWLSKLSSQKKQRDVLKNHQEGTGEFLLKSQEFMDWLDGKNRILWCIGPPGTGKTVLASIIIDTVKKTLASSKVGIAFLYCVYAERNDQIIDQLLGSIIQQLLLQQSIIPEDLLELYNSHKRFNTPPHLDELSKHLGSIVSLFSKVYIVVDALDECDDTHKTRSSLLAQLQNLDAHVQLFFTSRPLEEILLDAVQFKVTAQEDDMRKYLSAQIKQEPRLAKLCAHNGGLEDEILDKIIARVDGMFLLARLHLQSIASKLRVVTVRKALETLPERLNDTYDDVMDRIQKGQEKDRSELAMKMFMLLSYALRPLKLGEIQHALLTMEAEADETSIDRADVYDKELLLTICAGIIILEDGTSTIRFVHHTAETYFEPRRERLFKNAQSELTKLCVAYLSFDEFKSGPCRTDAEFGERLRSNPLYDYAAHNWGHHAREASTSCRAVVEFLQCDTKVEASGQALMAVKQDFWKSGYSQKVPRQLTGLHLAAYFGVEEIANILLGQAPNPNLGDSHGRTPLSYAAQRGHEAVFKLLLGKGADVNSRDSGGWTPLSYAAERGHEAMVKLLLANNGVDPNYKDYEYGRTPLLWAARNGHEALIKLLLTKDGIDVNSKDIYGLTPLSWLAQNGKETAVKLLLSQHGVDPNSSDRNEQTPLSWAAAKGRDAVVKQLLANGRVNPDFKSNYGQSPLWWAAEKGHEAVVKLLLANDGVDPNSKDSDYKRTPLSLAAERGHEAMVRLLLANDRVDPDSKDSDYTQTSMTWSAAKGLEAVIREAGVAPSPIADYIQASLSLAATNRHKAVFMAARDAPNSIADYKRASLSLPTANRHEAVVRPLLAKDGVDTDSEDSGYGRTPLCRERTRGCHAVATREGCQYQGEG
ncbi:hypothetical protein FOVG_16580 [Fusarium oxysporum f. sp. pisi HDV247]|uniref:Nephrocystin 3-like N-terminal domain-containing protein n=1 Tax=Fusarium oxysporum f. sp. pisi HDV247 TaxID=1080344 RepID=W9NHM7_FUSOX|nr:hypothetical protein FOVG_16580 [Fusarium oxysporum f. sp. pisi HDV247]